MRKPVRCIVGAAIMAIAPICAAAAELRLVFDIPSNHPRVPYFTAMADKVALASSGKLTIDANPGGKVHPGFASIEALKSGDADLTFVNASNLENLDPAFGFINLPFTLDDRAMADERVRRGVVNLLDTLARKHGLRVIGLMRGADQLFIFKDKSVASLSDLEKLKIRVAGPGIYEDIMHRLAVTPIVLPIPQMKPAFEKGTLNGVFTSPGAWASQLGMTAPKATYAPGLMMITYVLVARKDVIDRLSDGDRDALLEAASTEITEAWVRMNNDDKAILDEMSAKGADITKIVDLKPWRDAVSPVSAAFATRFPDTWGAFKAQMALRGN